jgi:DNA/RNA endonuclease YhcR with UshA esterase domain
MRKLGYALAVSVLTCGIVAAQEVQQKTKSKVSVEDGKDVTVTGCVQRAADGTFTLSNVAGKDGALAGYVLATDDDDVAKYVGHRVEITGKAADKGKGKIKVETKNEIKNADGDKSKTESRSEVKGDLKGLPYLGVKSLRSIATVCP